MSSLAVEQVFAPTAASAAAYHVGSALPGRRALRTLRIGLLGLGQVGQAVLRVAQAEAARFASLGLRLEFPAALVRDTAKARGGVRFAGRITDDPTDFLSNDYDVVIEALGGIRPAARLVRTLLERGIPVVTANKALLAARGPELQAVAAATNTWLRGDASTIAGVPLLTVFRARPLATRVAWLQAILNGTSNHVLTASARSGLSLGDAVQSAQRLGLAEPDPQRDLSGLDAADKLAVLLQHLGHAAVRPGDFEVTGLDGLRPADFKAAAELGGVIKPVAAARIHASSQPGQSPIEAFVGPAFVQHGHALASVAGAQNGLAFGGPQIGELFYSGPGAGPDVTAGTILDDVLEGVFAAPVAATADRPARERDPASAASDQESANRGASEIAAPATPWFVRVDFRGLPPTPYEAADFLASLGVWFSRTSDRLQSSGTLYGLTLPIDRPGIVRALNGLADATGGTWFAIRALENSDVE